MKVYSVYDPEFKEYGRVIKGYDTAELMAGLAKTPCPEGTIYIASDPELEKLPIYKDFCDALWGGLPVQIGYCNGHNSKMNALEYHRNSELNLPDEDIILLLARQQDITEDDTLDSATVKAFRVPKNVLVEVYATSLHYAPCHTSEKGFRCIVVLPKGTNEDLEVKPAVADGEEKMLAAKNKWLIGHPEGGLAEGSWIGITGENIEV